MIARAEAEGLRITQDYLSIPLILLALISDKESAAGKALADRRVTLETARKCVEEYLGRGYGYAKSNMQLHYGTKEILDASRDISASMGHSSVNSNHVLLALLAADTNGVHLLRKMNVDIFLLKMELLEQLKAASQIQDCEDVIYWPEGASKRFYFIREYEKACAKLAV